MKIDKYFISILFAGMVFCTTSCYDMDVFPQNQLGPGNFWKTEKDIQMALTGVYSKMKQGNKDWQLYWLDGMTDNAYCQHVTQSSYYDIQMGNLQPVLGGPVSGIYAGNYSGIAACNNFLKNFPQAKMNAKISESKANEYEAEVRFLRAWCYFELVERYGDIPLYKESIESVEASKVKQSPKEEVYRFIYEDLEYAIQNLPDIAYGSGHAVKASAQGLMARIALFQSKWDVVTDVTQDIIASGMYRLADTYESIFIKKHGQKNNPEILFSITYLNPDIRHDGEVEYYYRSALTPLDNLMSLYDHQKDKRAQAWYVNVGVGGREWVNPMGETVQTGYMSMTGWISVKHFDKYDAELYRFGDYDFRTDNDIVILRYADIYLMYIEAMVEKGGGVTTDGQAITYMNEIRKRAGLTELKSINRIDLRQERRRELAFEGLRHYDLLRWGIAKEVMSGLVTPSGNCKFEDHFYIWPFPQSEMDINPNLDQKDGYN